MTPTPATIVALGVFFGMLTASAAVGSWMQARAIVGSPDGARSAVRQATSVSRFERSLGRLATPVDPGRREELRDLLVQAGLDHDETFFAWLALRTLATIGLPVALWMTFPSTTWAGAIGWTALAAALGYYAPLWFVRALRARRQRRIRSAVPNLLDMLVSCVEAGLSIDMALLHVASEIGVASKELAEELDRVNAEVRAGVPRSEALGHLERRTAVFELGSLAQVLGVVERFGSGIAQSLRAHAHLSRRRRTLQAEQRAAKASPALTVVMVLFILPALFVVLMGPTFVRVADWLIPSISGGTL